MTTTERHAVTVLLTEEHLRKMIDDHLLKEEEMGDRVKVARVVKKSWTLVWDFPIHPGTIGMNG